MERRAFCPRFSTLRASEPVAPKKKTKEHHG
jgi:hypothetical protein